jgi:hypothetical protein
MSSNARNFANQVSNLIQISTGGSNFEEDIVYSSSSPVTASVGTLWVDSSGANPMMKVWDGSSWDSLGSAPVPIITGIAPDNIAGTASTAVIINGTNFESGSIVKLINTSNTELFTLSTTFNNARSLQFLTPSLTASAGPYDVKVTNPDNQISILENALTVGNTPVWSTATGSLGQIYESARSSTTFSLLATDADNQSVSYELVSGSLPTGMSMTSGGVISGTAQAVASDTTYAFTIRARDTQNNFLDRSFSITTKSPIVQSFTTGSTTWTAPVTGNIRVLVVAGGGGGGLQVGGGGGAGGLIYNTSFSVTANQSYALSVGAGGNGASSSSTHGSNGSNSVFSNLTAIGGGGGGSHANNGVSTSGGSGGGGGANAGTGGSPGTAGQGNSGGTGFSSSWGGGGGGGAGFAGNNATAGFGGKGGDGLLIDITGSAVYYAGGGGGCSDGSNSGSNGGLGGGGAGRSNATFGVQNATANTGGGGGGIRDSGSPGSGGSGIVVVRY